MIIMTKGGHYSAMDSAEGQGTLGLSDPQGGCSQVVLHSRLESAGNILPLWEFQLDGPLAWFPQGFRKVLSLELLPFESVLGSGPWLLSC